MKKKIFKLVFVVIVMMGAIALLAAPFVAFGQDANSPAASAGSVDVGEENILALLKAMFFQVLKSPGSLLVIIALVILSAMVEIVEWIPSNTVKVILPLCVIGGGGTYWLFSAAASVEKSFPYPHAVLFVNGLICGLAAFVIHIYVVKLILSKINPPKPPSV